MEKRYCLGVFANCARYTVASKLERDKVPQNLYPHQKDRADPVLQGAGADWFAANLKCQAKPGTRVKGKK
jgi:hypothetical protein